MMRDLCYTCRHRVENCCPCPENILEGKCGRYRCIAFVEDVDDGGGTYRCSFCGKLLMSRFTAKCPECGAEYGR